MLGACKNYAPLLPEMAGVDPVRLLAALAMNESTVGMNCGPKHEDTWDVGGRYASDPVQAKNLEMFPYTAAMSYGPWQIMFYNAPGYTPTELNTQLLLVTRATIAYLSKQIQRWKITTVQQIGEMWNWGHPSKPGEFSKDPAGVQLYCQELSGNYIAAEGWLTGVVTK